MTSTDPEQARTYRREQARARRAAGLCVNCGSRAEESFRRCGPCRERHNAAARAKRL